MHRISYNLPYSNYKTRIIYRWIFPRSRDFPTATLDPLQRSSWAAEAWAYPREILQRMLGLPGTQQGVPAIFRGGGWPSWGCTPDDWDTEEKWDI